jgi:hypothetical protein
MGFMQINTKMSLSGTGKHIRKKINVGPRNTGASQNVLGRYRKAHAKKNQCRTRQYGNILIN